MDGLHSDGDKNTGDEARDVARCRRWVVRGRGCEPMVVADRLGMELLPECPDPRRPALAAKNAETGRDGDFGTQYGGAQLLVAVLGVRRRSNQAGMSRFFLRASARS